MFDNRYLLCTATGNKIEEPAVFVVGPEFDCLISIR